MGCILWRCERLDVGVIEMQSGFLGGMNVWDRDEA